MAAMKPRTGEGPLEVTKEGRGLVMRVPLEGGGRLVVELSPDEAAALSEALKGQLQPEQDRGISPAGASVDCIGGKSSKLQAEDG